MDEKLKILLGSEDIIARNNEDLYININLNRSFFEYKKEKYDNDFDLAKQFDKERNLSRDFRIYGIVDSNVINTNFISLRVYSDSGATNLVQQISTSSMNFNDNINVFNKKRGKYLINLNNYSGNSIYIKTPTNNDTISEQIFEQQLVFYDFDGNFIPYGTETIEVDNNLNTIEIDNNFPFFYNKHWIKKNISLQETKYSVVNFSGSNSTIYEGDVLNIVVYLDKPSPFGNEKVDFVFDSGTADSFDFLVYSGATSNSFPGNVQLSFSQGEQYKYISFSASTDNLVEILENYKFRLDNFIKVKSGNSLSYTVQIENLTPRTYAIYELSGLYENRLPYLGFSSNTFSSTSLFSTPSILRNGLFYGGAQNEFYPIDEVVVDITNFSTNTALLPIGSGFGNSDDEVWLPGDTKTFTLMPQYSTDILNEVSIYLPPSLNAIVLDQFSNPFVTTQLSINQVIENISINGFKMQYNIGVYPFGSLVPNGQSASYEALKSLLGGGVYDIYNIEGLYKPFTVVTDDVNYKLKLIAKSPGVRLDVKTNVGQNPNAGFIATATTITQFTYPEQIPFQFTLLGNENNGQVANYQFKFRKTGYKDLNITNTALASDIGQVNYLVTSLKDVLNNWNTLANSPIAFSGNPIQVGFFPNRYFLPKSEAFYPGLLLLNGADVTNPSAANLTAYGANAFSTQSSPTEPVVIDSGRWYQSPLNTILKTSNELSTENVSQVTMMKVSTPAGATAPTGPNPTFYSFKYRNGTSGNYTTFYWNNAKNANQLVNLAANLKISGSTLTPRNSPGLKYEIDLGTTYAGQVIPPGPIKVSYPGYNSFEIASIGFYSPYHPTTTTNNNINFVTNGTLEFILSAKTMGTPFEIKEVVNNNGNAKIFVMPIFYNEIAGVTSNPYNNKMGGFSIIAP
jgi:hypothetical protein